MKLLANIAILFLFLAPLISNAQDIHSRWVNRPVTIDGNPAEWPQPFRYYDTNTKLQFAIANDSANIYVCLKVTDEPTQMKLFRAGLNIWVDPKGKHKQITGINFPMKVTVPAGEMPRQQKNETGGQIPGQSYQKHDFNQMKARIITHQQELKLTGFAGVPDQVAPLQNNYGIITAFDWDSLNILTIEYQIPISRALGHSLTSADTIKAIGMGFLESALESEHKSGESGEQSGGSGMGGHGGGMGGGMGGGGMNGMGGGGMGRGGGGMGRGGGGGYGGGGGGGSTLNQEQKLWNKLFLAYR